MWRHPDFSQKTITFIFSSTADFTGSTLWGVIEPVAVSGDFPPNIPNDTLEVLKDFGLYLRMYSGTSDFYFNTLVPSMKYFWFLPVNLTIVLDDTPEDRALAELIGADYPYPKVCFQPKVDEKYYHGKGYDLQQLDMFLIEKCFDKKYVGFIDTDTMFVTSATPELMFNGSKPIMIGTYGYPIFSRRKGTHFALGKKEAFNFMAYFPMAIKVDHIIELRRHMEKTHRMPFLDVFEKFSGDAYSQFSIMCNYVWYYHREEYQFKAQFTWHHRPWTPNSHVEGRQAAGYYQEQLTEDMRFPMPRSSIHTKVHNTCMHSTDTQASTHTHTHTEREIQKDMYTHMCTWCRLSRYHTNQKEWPLKIQPSGQFLPNNRCVLKWREQISVLVHSGLTSVLDVLKSLCDFFGIFWKIQKDRKHLISFLQYHPAWLQQPNGQRQVLHEAICYSGGFELCPDLCQEFNQSAAQKTLFHFNNHFDWIWDGRCVEAQNLHYWNLETHYRNESSPGILKGCEDIRNNRVPQFRKTDKDPKLPV